MAEHVMATPESVNTFIITRLQEEMTKLKQRVDDHAHMIEELGDIVSDTGKHEEKVSESEPEKEWPQEDDDFCYIDQFGNVTSGKWEDSFVHWKMNEIGNAFRSDYETLQAVERLKAIKRLKDAGLTVAEPSFVTTESGTFEASGRINHNYRGWDYDLRIVLGLEQPLTK